MGQTVLKPPFHPETEEALKRNKLNPAEVSEIISGKKPVAVLRSGIRFKLSEMPTQQHSEAPNTQAVDLPDLSAVERKLSEKIDKSKEEAEIKRRRQYLERVETLLPQIEKELLEIEAIEDWELSDKYRKRHQELMNQIRKLPTNNPGVQYALKLRLYTAKIRRATADQKFDDDTERSLYQEGVELNRLTEKPKSELRRPDGKWLPRTIIPRFPTPFAYQFLGSEENKQNQAIETELRKYHKAKDEYKQQVYEQTIDQMKAAATPGLSLLAIARGQKLTPGQVYGYRPRYKETLEDGRVIFRPEVHLLSEFNGKDIIPLKAAGNLNDWISEMARKRRRVPLEFLMQAVAFPDKRPKLGLRLPPEVFKEILKLAFIYRDMVLEEMRAEAQKKTAETPAEPAQPTEVEKPTETPVEPSQPAEEKKDLKKEEKGC